VLVLVLLLVLDGTTVQHGDNDETRGRRCQRRQISAHSSTKTTT